MSSAARTLEISRSQRRFVESLTKGDLAGLDRVDLAQPPIRLAAEILSTKRVPANAGVSYGHTYRTVSETTLALVSIGYGHGIPRKAGNQSQVTWWDSVASRIVRFPIVGRVAMDVLVVDVGDAEPRAGESLVLFGNPDSGEISLREWADCVGESPVTLVGALDARVTRVERE